MNSSTSCCCTSRKYSAMVSADSATRRRVPGGSSIWPKTSAVSLMTPDSLISRNRSLPSRVRSPTPAKQETPPKFFGNAGDHLLDEHRLAHAGAAEQADLAALDVRGEQVDDLDAGLQDLGPRLQLVERRRVAVDRPALLDLQVACRHVERLAEDVEHVALGDVADRDRDGAAGVGHLGAADQAVGRAASRSPGRCRRRGAARPPASASWSRRPGSRPRAARCRSPASPRSRTRRRRPGR